MELIMEGLLSEIVGGMTIYRTPYFPGDGGKTCQIIGYDFDDNGTPDYAWKNCFYY